jgi:hypothetical protein
MNCKTYVDCAATPTLLGFNSNTPDVQMFVGLGFGPNTPPPLGWAFSRATAFSIAYSPISVSAAQATAYLNAVSSAQSDWVPPGGVEPIDFGNFPPDDTFNGVPGGISEPPLI